MEKMEVLLTKTFMNYNSPQFDIVHASKPIPHFFIDRKNDRLGFSNFLPCTQFRIHTTSFSYKISNFFTMPVVPFPNQHQSTNCKLFYC